MGYKDPLVRLHIDDGSAKELVEKAFFKTIARALRAGGVLYNMAKSAECVASHTSYSTYDFHLP